MANNRTLTITVAGDDRSWLRTVKSVDEGAKKIYRSVGETDKSTTALAGTMKSLYSTAAKVGSLGLAAQGISALGAGAVAATSSLGPLAGALGAIPSLASAGVQGMGVFQLATSNILDAVGGLNESLVTTSKAFKELDPQAKKIALRLEELKKPIRELSGVAQKGMFPGFEEGIVAISKNLPVLERGVGRTAKVLGDLAEQAGRALGSGGFGRDLETQMKRNDVTIRRFGAGALNLFDAIRHVTIAAGPMVDFFTDAGVGLTELIEKQAKAGRESSALARFFHETEIVGSRVGRIISDLGKALVNIGTIAYNTLGKELLGDLTKATDQFRVWTDSVRGQNAIKKFFEDAEPAIRELASLTKDITVAFFELGRGDQVAPLLRTVRTELLPAIKAMVAGTTKEFMPAFLAFATESIKLFTHLGGTSGPLVQFTILMGRIVGGVNKLLDKFPLLNDAVVGLVVGGGIAKALKIGAAVSGMTTLIGMLKTAAGIGAAGGAARTGGGVAGKVKDVVTGAGKVRGATPANPLFVFQVNETPGGKIPDGILGKVAKAGALRVAMVSIGAPAAGIIATAIGAYFLARETRKNDFETRGKEPADRAQAGKAPRDNRGAFDRVLKDVKPLQNVPALNKLADALDRVSGSGKGGRAPQVKVLADRMREALRQGDARKIGQVADALDRVAGQGSGKSSRMLRDLAAEARNLASRGGDDLRKTRRELGLTRNEFARMNDDGSVSMREIRQTVGRNTKRIKDHLGNDTAAGKRALAQNFREARKAVRETMRDSTVSTRTGLKQIRELMARELKATYGISLKGARQIASKEKVEGATGGDSPSGGGPIDYARGGRIKLAGGGWIGGRGMISDDVVPIGPGALAAYGEYFATGTGGRGAVLNRHQAPTVDAHLAMGGYPTLDQGADLPTIEQAMGGPTGLNQLFATVTRPHRYARGGIVPVPGFPGESANRSVIGKIVSIAKRFGLTLTDAYGQGHKSPGHTKTGTAADFAGPDRSMDAAVKMLVGQGYLVGYDGRFGSQKWPGHGPTSAAGGNAHLHVELGGKGGKITGGAGASHRPIVAPKIKGGGAVGRAAQQGLKMAARAANRTMARAGEAALSMPVGGGGDPKAMSADANVVAAFRRAIKTTRAPAKAALALFEAGIVESGLRNLTGGDADSEGALQLRVGIHGRGLARNPYASAVAFLTRGFTGRGGAIALSRSRRSAGMVAADVQGPAAQYRGRYDQVAGRAQRYLQSGGRVRGFQSGGSTTKNVYALIARALSRVAPLQSGGSTPAVEFTSRVVAGARDHISWPQSQVADLPSSTPEATRAVRQGRLAKQTVIHESAHTRQPKWPAKRAAEGVARLSARPVTPRVWGASEVPFQRVEGDGSYTDPVRRVTRQLGDKLARGTQLAGSRAQIPGVAREEYSGHGPERRVQLGGRVREFKLGGRIGKPFRDLATKIWHAQAGLMGSTRALPTLRTGRLGYLAANAYAGGPVTLDPSVEQTVMSPEKGSRRVQALSTLVHEFAHVAQNPKLHKGAKWDGEGGAEWWRTSKFSQVMRGAGVNYTGSATVHPRYAGALRRVKREKNARWLEREQFQGGRQLGGRVRRFQSGGTTELTQPTQQGLRMAPAATRTPTRAEKASAVAGAVAPIRAAAPTGQVRQWLATGLKLAGRVASVSNIRTLYGRVMQEFGDNPQGIKTSDAKAEKPSKGSLRIVGSERRAKGISKPVHKVATATTAKTGYARGGRIRGFQIGGRDNFYSGFKAATKKGVAFKGDSFYAGFHSAKQQSEATQRAMAPPVAAGGKAGAGATTGAGATGYTMDVARAQRGQATARAKDNLASLIKAMVSEIRAKRRRLKRIRKVLKGRIKKARRQRLVEEETQLIGEIADLAAAIKEYRADAAGGATTVSRAEELDAGVDTEAAANADAAAAQAAADEADRVANLPTAADYIQAKIDEASLTPDMADDKAALGELVNLRAGELGAARASGDPRRISEAIQAYKAATEALNGVDDSAQRLAETMKSLQEEMKRQNDIYQSVIGVSSREAVRAMADMISGQIVGVGLQGRRQTAGTGTVALMP